MNTFLNVLVALHLLLAFIGWAWMWVKIMDWALDNTLGRFLEWHAKRKQTRRIGEHTAWKE